MVALFYARALRNCRRKLSSFAKRPACGKHLRLAVTPPTHRVPRFVRVLVRSCQNISVGAAVLSQETKPEPIKNDLSVTLNKRLSAFFPDDH